jgi:hypothetical protein
LRGDLGVPDETWRRWTDENSSNQIADERRQTQPGGDESEDQRETEPRCEDGD